MSTTQQDAPATTAEPTAGTVPAKFEVTTLPVADVDRAKAFYQRLGWRLDIDFEPAPGVRGVQFTPPGSPASIQFGSGGPASTEPLQGLILAVEDIVAARDDLVRRGVEVSDVFSTVPGKGIVPGLDPERRSYFSRATFADPDGNAWQIQEVTERLPGRVESKAEDLSRLLFEAAEHHGVFEAAAPPHDWWDWYAAYMDARQTGATPDQADATADRYLAETKGVVASRDLPATA
jgi:catechol 2,3-dioxygenase-like lactoylglutathione lyase family enzyme